MRGLFRPRARTSCSRLGFCRFLRGLRRLGSQPEMTSPRSTPITPMEEYHYRAKPRFCQELLISLSTANEESILWLYRPFRVFDVFRGYIFKPRKARIAPKGFDFMPSPNFGVFSVFQGYIC